MKRGAICFLLGISLFVSSCSRSTRPHLDVAPLGSPHDVVINYAIADARVKSLIGDNNQTTGDTVRTETLSWNGGILFWKSSGTIERRGLMLSGDEGSGLLEYELRYKDGVWEIETLDFEGETLLATDGPAIGGK